ncbi:hypothetical protein HF521_016965 [Silurus meridionalis]|uniref:Uncharacterized protein n=1 Tax=Silurus meridionalis TaxID=175797 RepID=A0A8T0BLF0_SILME|nr:hypothetical protein HF521_016965 [Silurus meridionalis]
MKSDDLKRVELRLQTADGLLRRNINTTREVRDMAESQLLKNIGDVIAGVLLDLPDQLDKSVEDTLKTLGAATTDDLKNVTENNLLPVLKPIQARRLVAAWTQNTIQLKLLRRSGFHTPAINQKRGSSSLQTQHLFQLYQ